MPNQALSLTIGATLNAEQVEYTDSHATYRIDLSILGRPSRTCLLECDIRGTTLHMSEIQMRPDKGPLLEQAIPACDSPPVCFFPASTGLKMVEMSRNIACG